MTTTDSPTSLTLAAEADVPLLSTEDASVVGSSESSSNSSDEAKADVPASGLRLIEAG